jgi:hypothetical protein
VASRPVRCTPAAFTRPAPFKGPSGAGGWLGLGARASTHQHQLLLSNAATPAPVPPKTSAPTAARLAPEPVWNAPLGVSSDRGQAAQRPSSPDGRGPLRWTTPLGAGLALLRLLGTGAARVGAHFAPGNAGAPEAGCLSDHRVFPSLVRAGGRTQAIATGQPPRRLAPAPRNMITNASLTPCPCPQLPRGAAGAPCGKPAAPGARGPALLWFRNDLRLSDNEALAAANAATSLVPVYIFDDREFGKVRASGVIGRGLHQWPVAAHEWSSGVWGESESELLWHRPAVCTAARPKPGTPFQGPRPSCLTCPSRLLALTLRGRTAPRSSWARCTSCAARCGTAAAS